MKSDLYRIIYRIAIFCIVATAGLTIGGILLSCHVLRSVEYSTPARMVAIGAAVLGLVLCGASVIGMLHFKKQYQNECPCNDRREDDETNVI